MRGCEVRPVRSEMVAVDGIGLGLLTIPKVAATSLRVALLAAVGEEPRPGRQVHHHPALRRVRDAPCTVTFVRHPLDRLVSCWADRVRGSGGRSPSAPMRALGYRPSMDFAHFVAHVAGVGTDADPHTRRQVDYLAAHRVDRVRRFERIADDWDALRRRFPALPPLGHHQRSERGPWQDYYDDRTRRLARELYERDLAELGYRCE